MEYDNKIILKNNSQIKTKENNNVQKALFISYK